MMDIIRINKSDNVGVALRRIKSGETLNAEQVPITALEDIPALHKIAVLPVKKGAPVIKYGECIGYAALDIPSGAFVHTHNLITGLKGRTDYSYIKKDTTLSFPDYMPRKFKAYRRSDGRVGIRNNILILPTVGCAASPCRKIKENYEKRNPDAGIMIAEHDFGCSQLGGDLINTQKILSAVSKNPDFGGVLIVSLGCENNNLNAFMPFIGSIDKARVKTLVLQECRDETAESAALLDELAEIISRDVRTECDISELVIGIKCGGSDALSGITANPLVGFVSETVIAGGGSVIMTEIPEMFGAEQVLSGRCRDKKVFDELSGLCGDFKNYFIKNGEKISENPSPGNRDGGITTLEEKSLGCVLKSGRGRIDDIIRYGETRRTKGVTILEAPGNDIVSSTALAAAGAQLILFTSGRGTPLGSLVPVIKIASNSALAKTKPGWTDFDAGQVFSFESFFRPSKMLTELVIKVAEGKVTANEKNGYHEFTIWKNGITL